MKEAVFCSNMVLELGFKEGFGSVPLYIDNTSALHVPSNRTYSPPAKNIALRYFFVQELVEEGKITIHFCENTTPNRRSRNQARQQAPSPCPHRAQQGIRDVKDREMASDVVKHGSARDYNISAPGSVSVCSYLSVRPVTCTNAQIHHSTFLFSRVKGLVVFSGILLLFKFSVWTVHFCMRFAFRGSMKSG